MQRLLIKKCFLFTVGSVCRLRRFTTGSRRNHLGGKRLADDEAVETEVRKWLRQQSNDVCSADFDSLVKRLDKCINVGGGYDEQYFFRLEGHMFYVLYRFMTYLLTVPRT
jgi:hypothetical protein